MNFKTTLVLLILLAAACGAYYYTRDKPSTYDLVQTEKIEKINEGQKPLHDQEIQPEFIARIEIQQAGKRLLFEKQDHEWFQIEPLRVALQTWPVNNLVEDILSLRYHEKFIANEDGMPTLEDVQLSPKPVASIRLYQVDALDRPVVALSLGRATTINSTHSTNDGGLMYVRHTDAQDKQVYVVSGKIMAELVSRGEDGWRQMLMKTPSVSSLQSITLGLGFAHDAQVHVTKSQENKTSWQFGGAMKGRVSEKAIASFIDHLDGLKVVSFVDNQPERYGTYGLGSASHEILLDWGDKKIAVTLGAATDLLRDAFFVGWRVDEQPMTVVSVSKEDFEKLNVNPERWRDPYLTSADIDQIKHITLTSNDRAHHYDLTRTTDEWHFSDKSIGYAPDRESVTVVLAALKSAQAVSFIDLHAVSANPFATLTLNNDEILTFHHQTQTADNQVDKNTTTNNTTNATKANKAPSETQANVIVTRSGDAVSRVVPYESIKPLLTSPASLRDRTILDLEASAVNRFYIHQAGKTEPLLFEQQVNETASTANGQPWANQWQLAGATSYERTALNELLGVLLPLRAESWLDDNHVIGPSRTEVVIDAIDGSQGFLTIDSQTGAAIVEGFSGVFKLSDRTFEAIHAEFQDRTVLAIATGDIEQLTIRQLAGPMTFEPDKRAANGLTLISPAGAAGDINGERFTAILKLIERLRVTRYVDDLGDIELDDSRRVDIDVTTANGSQRHLSFWPTAPTNPGFDRDSQRWFLLSDAMMNTLEMPLLESE